MVVWKLLWNLSNVIEEEYWFEFKNLIMRFIVLNYIMYLRICICLILFVFDVVIVFVVVIVVVVLL